MNTIGPHLDRLKAFGFAATGRTPICRYAVSAHDLSTGLAGTSGISRTSGNTPGSDFIVSLGSWVRTDLIMATTFSKFGVWTFVEVCLGPSLLPDDPNAWLRITFHSKNNG